MSITELRDAQYLSPAIKANRIDPLSPGGDIPLKGASVISRNSPIVVQRQSSDSEAMCTVGSIEVVGTGRPAVEPVFAERAGGYADDSLIKQAVSSENAIGVTSTPRSVTVISGRNDPIPGQRLAQPDQRVHEMPVAESRHTVTQVTTHKPKIRVRLSNAGMGKLTVAVQQLAVSETLIILGYPKDAENIAEPPLAGEESPIKVEIGTDSYQCMFGGWTAELGDLFLVVLVRITA